MALKKKKKKHPAKKAAKKKILRRPQKKKAAKAARSPLRKVGRTKNKLMVRSTKAQIKKEGLHIVYLGLGSNVGDREEYIEQAIFLLGKAPGIKVVARSQNYETEAEGVGDQPPFLNAVVEIETTVMPHKLLSAVQEIETTLGREREAEWGPRTIDLDILLYDDEIISDDKLQIPHPLLHERTFVLRPLAEIAPDAVHPILERSIRELYEEKKLEAGEKYDDELPGFKEIKGGVVDDFERW